LKQVLTICDVNTINVLISTYKEDIVYGR